MDLSKLPKLSGDRPEVPPPRSPSEPAYATEQSGFAARASEPAPSVDIWISIAVGALTLLMYPRWLQWLSSVAFGTQFNQFVTPNGTIVPYPQVPEFWADFGPTIFGVALLMDGLILLAARRNLVAVGLGLLVTALATAYNAIYLITSFSKYGLALASALAVIVGVMVLLSQWPRFQNLLRSAGVR